VKKLTLWAFPTTHEGYEEFIERLTELNQEGFSPLGGEGHTGEVSPINKYLRREEIETDSYRILSGIPPGELVLQIDGHNLPDFSSHLTLA